MEPLRRWRGEPDKELIERLRERHTRDSDTIAQLQACIEANAGTVTGFQRALEDTRRLLDDARHQAVQAQNRVAELQAENAGVKARVASEMQAIQAKIREDEARIQSRAPTDGSSAQGICVHWHEQGHKTALESVFQAAARESNLPGNMCYEWSPGAKYALVIVPLFPATVKLDASVLDAIRDARASASSVVLVAMRWGVNAQELLLGQVRDCGAEVVNLYWEKDAADNKMLARCQKNDQNIATLRGIIQSAVPVRRASTSTWIGGVATRLGLPWR